MKPMKRREIIKKLKAAGFREQKHNGKTRGKGSHTRFKHPDGRATVVKKDTEIGPGEVRLIEKQSGIKLD